MTIGGRHEEAFTSAVLDELGPYYPHSLQQRSVKLVARLLLKNNRRRLRTRLG